MSAASTNVLTKGCISAIYNSVTPYPVNPILQVLNSKEIAKTEDKGKRHLLVLSDGEYTLQACTQIDAPPVFSLIKLLEYQVPVIKNRKKLIAIARHEVISKQPGTLGTPVNIERTPPNQQQPLQQQPPRQVQSQAPQQRQLQLQQQQRPGSSAAAPPPQQRVNQPPPSGMGRGALGRGSQPPPQGGLGRGSYSPNPRGVPQQPPPGSAASAPNEDISKSAIFPVNSLNPYQLKWVIKVRVTQKGQIREWKNTKGSGRLFSVDLLDDKGGEIRMTGFQDSIDKFYELLQVDHVYLISRCTLKFANKQYTSIKHDYELTLKVDSIIQEVTDDKTIKTQKYEFIQIGSLSRKKPNDLVDVIGVVVSPGAVGKIISKKDSAEYTKRVVTICDNSATSVELTLWGEQAELDVMVDSIVAIKSAKVSDYGGCSLSANKSSAITWNPTDIPEAETLREWKKASGDVSLTPLTNGKGGSGGGGGDLSKAPMVNLHELQEAGPTLKPDGDLFQVVGTITMIRHDGRFHYEACQTPQCNKKVSGDADNGYHCEKCNKDFQEPSYRYVLSITVSDHTGSAYFNCFNEQAKMMLGMECKELLDLGNQKSPSFELAFHEATFRKYIFGLRARAEEYNGDTRVKYSVLRATPLHPTNWTSDATRLITAIQRYE
ncbi:Replication protein A 70 kDa DNA-binding subunit [Pelomyxa schiedti]|nr:Replication protein A 70 kDa DNA-binding subunit [Pelomyxa schiedti]